MTSTTAILALIAAVLGIIATGAGLWASLRRQARSLAAVVDAVLGHEEARDRSGAVFQPAQPGLAARLSSVDAKLDRLINLDRRVADLEEGHANLTGRISVLEDSRVERALTQAESAAAWQAIGAAQTQPLDQPDLD